MENINKILETLTLSASDTREDTLKSIAVSSLLNTSNPIAYDELLGRIEIDFGIQLYELEFKQILGILTDESKIQYKDDKYSLPDSYRAELRTLEYRLRSKDTTRFTNFREFLESKYNKIDVDDLRLLWQLFREYIYECFYVYGVKANQLINPKYQSESENIFTNSDILQMLFVKMARPELNDILRFSVDNFQTYATEEDIDFLDDLGQKTLAFASLGLDPELARDSFENNLVEWTLFLDTNFLFSILDLHSNVEDDACKELLKLIAQNQEYIKIELKYTELTTVELRNKKADFAILDRNLSRNAISALLKSDDIDEFTRKFYSKLYGDPEKTLHPSEIIDLANVTLPKDHIELYRTKPMVDALGEDFLNARIQDYQRFINDLNSYRSEWLKTHSGRPFRELYRSDPQMIHDITLREVILYRRVSVRAKEIKTMNDARYFGVTLDELLLKYDNYELRKSQDGRYPTFFRPSYLLNKLVKVLPVKTKDYKKAFIKAVSSRGFNKDIRKSHDIVRIVSYLKSLGIDNEDVILNLINEQVFLEKFKEESRQDQFNVNAFFESELNALFERTNHELGEAKSKLEKVNSENDRNSSENKKLSALIGNLTDQVSVYQGELGKLHEQIKNIRTESHVEGISSYQTKMDFEGAQKDLRIQTLEGTVTTLKQEARIQEEKAIQAKKFIFVKKKRHRWRIWAWVLCLCCSLGSLIFIFKILRDNAWSLTATINAIKQDVLVSAIIAVCLGGLNYLFGKLLYDRYCNHSNIKAFEDRMSAKFFENLTDT
jgi:hypothetical protein